MTDTERIDWLQHHCATLHALSDDALIPTGYAVHHHTLGWGAARKTAREAIDEAAANTQSNALASWQRTFNS